MNFKTNLTLLALKILSKARKKFIGKYAVGVLYSTDNGLFVVGADDLGVGRSLAFRGKYDIPAIKELEKLFTSNSYVCVIGAHVGSLLIPIAKRVKYVVGYEANPYTFKLLELNVKINDLDNVSVYNYAIGNREGEIEFYASTVNSGGSKIKPKRDIYAYKYDNPMTINVSMVTLDDHSNNYEFGVILMDIEGAEYLALKGMPQKLTVCKHLQIEYVPHHLENVSRATNEEFLSTFASNFNSAIIVGEHDKIYTQDEFLPLLNNLRNSRKCVDLIFSK